MVELLSGSAALGVDGCRGGWLLAYQPQEAFPPQLEVAPSLARVSAYAPALALIDMPIGLSECASARECDVQLRAQRGVRSATVFNAPVRSAIACADHPSASAQNRSVSGKGLSIQSWNLVPRIRELDALLRSSAGLRDSAREAHPEWLFALLALRAGLDVPLPSKREKEGRGLRLHLLQHTAPRWSTHVAESAMRPPRGAAVDDALDSLVLVLAARAALRSGMVSLPPLAPTDAFAIPMAIVAPKCWVP